MLQQLAAHHGRQRQGHEARNDHRTGQGQGELHEQPAGASWRERQGREHGRQGERHRHHGKRDLARALQSRLERCQTFLDVAEDVLQHHDGVVHHQADGQHERQQREGVDAEARKGHERKHANQADGNRDQRDDRSPQCAQEQEHHQGHQRHGLGRGLVDRLDGAVDEHRVVVGDQEGDARWQVLLDQGHRFANPGRDAQRIGRGVSDDASGHRRQTVQADDGTLVRRALLDLGHVAQAHRMARGHLQRDLAELPLGVEVRTRRDVELPLLALDAPGRHFQVLPSQGVLDILHGQAVGGQAVLVQPDAHRELALAIDLHVGHARNGLQPGLDDAVDQVGDLQRRTVLAGEGQPDHREGVGLDLGDDGFLDAGGQSAPYPGDPVTDVCSRRVWILAQLEACRDLASLRS